MDDEKENI